MPKEQPQINLFGENYDELQHWKEEWKDMPEFNQSDLKAFQSVIVNFEKREDLDNFAKLIGQKLTYKTKSIWFPKCEEHIAITKQYISE